MLTRNLLSKAMREHAETRPLTRSGRESDQKLIPWVCLVGSFQETRIEFMNLYLGSPRPR